MPKRPRAEYRLTIDYQPVSAVTRRTFWPMPNIDAVSSDTGELKALAGIDFCSGYWQAPPNPESQSLLAFSTPDGVSCLLGLHRGAVTQHQTTKRRLNLVLQNSRDISKLVWMTLCYTLKTRTSYCIFKDVYLTSVEGED